MDDNENCKPYTLVRKNRFYPVFIILVLLFSSVGILLIAIEEYSPPSPKPLNVIDNIKSGREYLSAYRTQNGACPTGYTPYNSTACIKFIV